MAENNLEGKIEEWLRGQGYPLEMEVASALQKAKFNVRLADFYKDIETDTMREIDVTAASWSDFERPVSFQVCCRIECKLSTDKPWIIFVSETQQAEFWLPPLNLISSQLYHLFLLEAFKHKNFREKVLPLPLLRPQPVGHGITQAFNNGKDIPFQAITGAVKASIDRAITIDNTNQKMKNLASATVKQCIHSCVVFPVVVIDAKLFECSLNESGDILTKEVTNSVICWKGTRANNLITHSPLVHIVTKAYLHEFVRYLEVTTRKLMEATFSQEQILMDLARKYARQ